MNQSVDQSSRFNCGVIKKTAGTDVCLCVCDNVGFCNSPFCIFNYLFLGMIDICGVTVYFDSSPVQPCIPRSHAACHTYAGHTPAQPGALAMGSWSSLHGGRKL